MKHQSKYPIVTTENAAQVAVFGWAKLNERKYPGLELLNGSLNGVRLNIGQARKAKLAGMKKGYPDMFLPVARGGYHGLYIELKVKKNHCTPEQRAWLRALEDQGYKAVMCRGSGMAIEVIQDYMLGHYRLSTWGNYIERRLNSE